MPTPIVPGSTRNDLQMLGSGPPVARRIYHTPRDRASPGGHRLHPKSHDNRAGRGIGASPAARQAFQRPSISAAAAAVAAEERLAQQAAGTATSSKTTRRQIILPPPSDDDESDADVRRNTVVSQITVVHAPAAKRRKISGSIGTTSSPATAKPKATAEASSYFAQPINLDSGDEAETKKAPSISAEKARPSVKRQKARDVSDFGGLTYPSSDNISDPDDDTQVATSRRKSSVSDAANTSRARTRVLPTAFAPSKASKVFVKVQISRLKTRYSDKPVNAILQIAQRAFEVVDPERPNAVPKGIPVEHLLRWQYDDEAGDICVHCSKEQRDFDMATKIHFVLKNKEDSLSILRLSAVRNKSGTLNKMVAFPAAAKASPRNRSESPDAVHELRAPAVISARPQRLTRKPHPIIPGSRRDASKPLEDINLMSDARPALPTPRETRQRARIKALASDEPLLVYPHKAASSVTLYPDDVDRLRPGEFLNDSLIDYYLRYNFDHLPEQRRNEAYLFNTFFYKKLTQKSAVKGKESVTGHSAVEKWTRKANVDLFSKKYVIIPVNEALHWYLVVIANLDKCVFGDWTDTRTQRMHIEEEDSTEVLDVTEITDDEESSQKADEARPTTNESTFSVFGGMEQEAAKPAYSGLTAMLRSEQLGKLSTRDKVDGALAALRIDEAKQTPTISTPSKRKAKKKKQPSFKFTKPGKHLETDEPVILILDSLRNRHNKAYGTIKQYLAAEAETRHGKKLDTEQINTCLAAVPGQDNFSDCGLFLIHYADTLLKQPDVVLQDLLHRVAYKREESFQQAQEARKQLWRIETIATRRGDMVDEILSRGEAWKQVHMAEQQVKAQAKEAAGKDEMEAKEQDSLVEQPAPSSSQAKETEQADNQGSAHMAMDAMLSTMENEFVPATQSPARENPPSSPLTLPLVPLSTSSPKREQSLMHGPLASGVLDSLIDAVRTQRPARSEQEQDESRPELHTEVSEDPINMLRS